MSGLDPDMPLARLRPGGRGMGIRRARRPPNRNPPASSNSETIPAPRIREWHSFTAAERESEWQDLVEWVAWMHDRYELSVEERLPVCWPQHPGLIEELHALKTWRLEIYAQTAPPTPDHDSETDGANPIGGNGQAARYWHAELRQLLNAATAWYAAGCRSGHRGSALLHDQLRERWLQADPLLGVAENVIARQTVVASSRTHEQGDTMAWMSQMAMETAIDDGAARPLGEQVTEWVEYDGSWWSPASAEDRPGAPAGWQRITDRDLINVLDTSAERIRAADDAARRHRRQSSADSRNPYT